MTTSIHMKRSDTQCPECGNSKVYIRTGQCVHCTIKQRTAPLCGALDPAVSRPRLLTDERVAMAGVRYEDIGPHKPVAGRLRDV